MLIDSPPIWFILSYFTNCEIKSKIKSDHQVGFSTTAMIASSSMYIIPVI